MSTFSLKRIIGLTLFALGLGLAILPFRSALADDWSDPAVQYGYAVTRNDPVNFKSTDGNQRFGLKTQAELKSTDGNQRLETKTQADYERASKPTVNFDSTNGNQRLELKNRADIERASAPTIHMDTAVKANYMCDWAYDKVLGRWVCEKNYMKAYQYTHPNPVPVCPFGYKLNYGGSDCVRILYPQYAHLNARGDGWECNPGYHGNLTGSVCLSSKYVYQQCPGGSFNCGTPGGCQKTSYGSAFQQPILTAVPVIINQVTVNISNGQDDSDQDNPPDRPKAKTLPSTGPSILVSLFGLSALGARKLLKKV